MLEQKLLSMLNSHALNWTVRLVLLTTDKVIAYLNGRIIYFNWISISKVGCLREHEKCSISIATAAHL